VRHAYTAAHDAHVIAMLMSPPFSAIEKFDRLRWWLDLLFFFAMVQRLRAPLMDSCCAAHRSHKWRADHLTCVVNEVLKDDEG
jgi:hypothetical protein